MKKLLLACTLFSLLLSCSEDDTTMAASQQMEEEMQEQMAILPDATQTGAGTFGCLVNGEVFTEDDDAFNTVYAEAGGNFFFITGAFNLDGPVRQIRLEANQNTIEEGMTYPLGVAAPGGYFAEVLFFDSETPPTTGMDAGTMTITRLDPANNIVSGTFSFDILDNQGELVEIREGRFDQIYED